MNASLPTRRTLIGLAVLAGASALTGCATGDEPGGKGKKQSPSGRPEPTGTAGLEDAPPAADAASAASPDNAWRYTHLAPEPDGSYRAMAVASRDDVWLLGTRGQSAPVPFLEHWDGTRWSEPGLPDELKAGDRYFSWALAVDAPGELWLARRTGQGGGGPAVFHRKGGTWRRLPDPPAARGQVWADGLKEAAWCVASGTGLWINHYGKVLHWDGERWEVPALPFAAAALAAAPAEDGTARVWAAGWQDGECDRGTCYPQPATARWSDGVWQPLDTPAYRFPDPVPPEASATLAAIVHDPAGDRLWALGSHDFNHGEVEEEPDREEIVLTGDGTSWSKAGVADSGRAFMTATAVADGTGGLLLDAHTRRTGDGRVHKLRSPERLPEPSEVPKPKRKYDFKQPFDIAVTRLIPGTRTVLAAGSVTFANSSDSGSPPRRPALARYDADAAEGTD
ncbi:hypothetical protein [Streptomyces sp. enrichment culture]|uniref:hypothetical protein n=1 Tax=Streptomyces sp. enrichment culture TaxID=1795815 RepID=UPI003F562CB6